MLIKTNVHGHSKQPYLSMFPLLRFVRWKQYKARIVGYLGPRNLQKKLRRSDEPSSKLPIVAQTSYRSTSLVDRRDMGPSSRLEDRNTSGILCSCPALTWPNIDVSLCEVPQFSPCPRPCGLRQKARSPQHVLGHFETHPTCLTSTVVHTWTPKSCRMYVHFRCMST